MRDTWTYRNEIADTVGTGIDGYIVEATDGSIGTIDEHTVEATGSYLLVDTGVWIFGKKRVIPAGVVKQVDHEQQKVVVEMTKEQIKDAPDYDDSSRAQEGWYRSGSEYYDPYVMK